MIAGDETVTWALEIDVYSGRPNPVLTLTDVEIVRVKDLLSQASSVHETKDPATVFPSNLGYRSVLIKELREPGNMKSVRSVTRVRGRDILVQSGENRIWQKAKDATLERLLVDLALEKKAIPRELYQYILKEIEKR
jgi:hypothetical protein